jgi:PhnB protein
MKDPVPESHPTAFAPQLYMEDLSSAIEFYKSAFGAIELRRLSNPDGSVHVAEMSIPPALFRLHQEVSRAREYSPDTLEGTTVVIGLLVDDPDEMAANAVAAGGKEISPVKDYDYGYRQGTIQDPFGHHWLLEKRIEKDKSEYFKRKDAKAKR